MFSGLEQEKIEIFLNLRGREAEFKCWNGLGEEQQAGKWDLRWDPWSWVVAVGQVLWEVTGRKAGAGRGWLMAFMAQVFWVFRIWELFELLFLIEQ